VLDGHERKGKKRKDVFWLAIQQWWSDSHLKLSDDYQKAKRCLKHDEGQNTANEIDKKRSCHKGMLKLTANMLHTALKPN
jgi:hypothetical protein